MFFHINSLKKFIIITDLIQIQIYSKLRGRIIIQNIYLFLQTLP